MQTCGTPHVRRDVHQWADAMRVVSDAGAELLMYVKPVDPVTFCSESEHAHCQTGTTDVVAAGSAGVAAAHTLLCPSACSLSSVVLA